jgi:hypothetical protein
VSPTVRWLARASTVGIVVFCAGLWVYVFLIADAHPPDKLKDGSFAAAAAPVCKDAINAVYAGNLYFAKATTPQEQGQLVDQADTILKSMVTKLKSLSAPSDAEDARVVAGWLADWDVFLGDRDAWVAKLKAGEPAVFYVHGHEGGTPVSDAMDSFSIANNLIDCKTPNGF